MRLFVIARHAESTLNELSLVNGDPSVPVGLTKRGREESALLGLQVANIPLEACFHTRFARTRETARIALAGREVEFHEEPLLDDIDVGELEGKSIADYRTWKRAHTRDDRFPGGESMNDAARRYAEGFARVLAAPHEHVLVVCHEIPLRYALNGAAGSDQLDGPVRNLENARPFLFSEEALARAAERIAELAPLDTSGSMA
ncbi:MAG TPA: histidine phosphatase family protein [Gaiellaceae bacterium]|nr:histidine phosphatase family protein [Gaiellaceae bacterium]